MSETDFRIHALQETYSDNNRLVLMVKDPHCLYVYWDISDDIKAGFLKEFGNDIWEKSIAALKVSNVSQNYSFIIGVDNAQDSTYIGEANSSSLYCVELGRLVSGSYFISILKSNYAVTPTDNISSNSAAFFVNHMDMDEDWECGFLNNPYEWFTQDHSNNLFGLSSMQLMKQFSSYSGLSSYSYFTEEGKNIE